MDNDDFVSSRPLMTYRLAMFDFDGTLADSFPFFLSVFNTLAARHRFRPIDLARAGALRHYSVPEMMRHVGMPAWKLPLVAHGFIELMQQNSAHVKVFEGVPEAIGALADAGVRLALVSSNSEHNVRRILGPELAGRFAEVECGMAVLGKAARLRAVMKRMGCSGAESIYVGDHGADAQAAHRAGTAFGAVAWGYCPLPALRSHGPAMEFATPADLAAIAAARAPA